MADQEIPFEFHDLDEQLNQEIKEMVASQMPNFQIAESIPGRFRLPKQFTNHAVDFYRMTLRKDDTWIVTFPKCGTTWTIEMAWLLMNGFDTDKAKKIPQEKRVPFLEMTSFGDENFITASLADKMPDLMEVFADAMPLDTIDQLPSPRCIKTHLPLFILPPKLLDTCKVIYVARNPKDVIVSFYYHHLLIPNVEMNADLSTFARFFIKDKVLFAPYWPHLLEAWKLRDHPNMLFLFYEDMKNDLSSQVGKAARFLGQSPTEQDIECMTDHLTFGSMKQSGAVSKEKLQILVDDKPTGFLRKGIVGDWKQHITGDLLGEIHQWIEENTKNTGLEFRYEL